MWSQDTAALLGDVTGKLLVLPHCYTTHPFFEILSLWCLLSLVLKSTSMHSFVCFGVICFKLLIQLTLLDINWFTHIKILMQLSYTKLPKATVCRHWNWQHRTVAFSGKTLKMSTLLKVMHVSTSSHLMHTTQFTAIYLSQCILQTYM